MFSRSKILGAFGLVFFCASIFAAEKATPEIRLAKAGGEITTMEKVLKLFYEEVRKARKDDDVRRLNCLLEKLDLVRGFIKAAQRAKDVVTESAYGGDDTTAEAYLEKILAYAKHVSELEKSKSECFNGSTQPEEGTTLVYIRPAQEEIAGLETDKSLTPSDPGQGTASVEGYPVVPPASPYR
jgi:hypothetical protein